jgi:hypothetical protein
VGGPSITPPSAGGAARCRLHPLAEARPSDTLVALHVMWVDIQDRVQSEPLPQALARQHLLAFASLMGRRFVGLLACIR